MNGRLRLVNKEWYLPLDAFASSASPSRSTLSRALLSRDILESPRALGRDGFPWVNSPLSSTAPSFCTLDSSGCPFTSSASLLMWSSFSDGSSGKVFGGDSGLCVNDLVERFGETISCCAESLACAEPLASSNVS